MAFALLAVAALGTFVLTDATTFAAGVVAAVFIGFGSLAVATLMLSVPEPVAAGCGGGLADREGSL